MLGDACLKVFFVYCLFDVLSVLVYVCFVVVFRLCVLCAFNLSCVVCSRFVLCVLLLLSVIVLWLV